MAKNRKQRRSTRFDQYSDDELIARWKKILPRFRGTMIFSAAVAVAPYIFNHFVALPQKMTDYAAVAFQVTCALTICFAIMTGMGMYFASGRWRRAPES